MLIELINIDFKVRCNLFYIISSKQKLFIYSLKLKHEYENDDFSKVFDTSYTINS